MKPWGHWEGGLEENSQGVVARSPGRRSDVSVVVSELVLPSFVIPSVKPVIDVVRILAGARERGWALGQGKADLQGQGEQPVLWTVPRVVRFQDVSGLRDPEACLTWQGACSSWPVQWAGWGAGPARADSGEIQLILQPWVCGSSVGGRVSYLAVF